MILFPGGHYYDKNTFIKASLGTAHDAETVARTHWHKTERN